VFDRGKYREELVLNVTVLAVPGCCTDVIKQCHADVLKSLSSAMLLYRRH